MQHSTNIICCKRWFREGGRGWGDGRRGDGGGSGGGDGQGIKKKYLLRENLELKMKVVFKW